MKPTTTLEIEYKPEEFETRWQRAWEDSGIYRASTTSKRPKYYCLDYFPYPSGDGLHVGHCRNYVPTDVISRFKRMRGYNVLHPMGWDAFGEPAEQNAIKNGVTPRVTTDQNTANYKRQMQLIGTSYDWTREIDSSHPEYYRWTQWMFLKMYRRGLAYRDTNWQWWCPVCATTLSSHEIEGDHCWRGHSGATKKEIPAWYFKITAYADELITGLETVDWPEPIKRMQQHWIGRSEGLEIQFGVVGDPSAQIDNRTSEIRTFTTRPDTVYGVTFMALAPEHPLVYLLTTEDRRAEVETYIDHAIRLSEIDRKSEGRVVTGVFSGGYVVNPVNQVRVPVFVADYVMPSYGTGAVMGVPAHDQRDYMFAQKYGLAVRQVVQPYMTDNGQSKTLTQAYIDPGFLVNSGPFDGLSSEEGSARIADYLEGAGRGSRSVNFRMRDWLISRQRYWGTPIPILHCNTCGEVPVAESDLPVLLPEMDDFTPDGSGRSPLGRVPSFVSVKCPQCGGSAQRETDTMGGFACSSWYFSRFTSPHYHNGPFEPGAMEYWMPVDLYVGGAEHAVLHLLYSRFWTKALADEGLVSFREPFSRLVNQGQLHGPDGLRMSKSRGNVIIPDDIVARYGADALRIYGMFMAPFEQSVDWNTNGITGARRFLSRVWNLYQAYWTGDHPQQVDAKEMLRAVDMELERMLHKSIKVITERIEDFRFNTMISALMEFVNALYERVRTNQWHTDIFQECLQVLMVLLAPAAPYIAEELWSKTGHTFSVHQQDWPSWDESLIRDELVEIAIQVNGRARGVINIAPDTKETEALNAAGEVLEIQRYLSGKEIARVIYVPGKILNVVTRA
jgi:leucyl-tRNA synthetase